MTTREVRTALSEYFGQAKHTVTIERCLGKKYVIVLYEDFLPQPMVRNVLSHRLSAECRVSAFRSLSETKRKQIDDWMTHNIGNNLFFDAIYANFP